mgnify:CR=1 FL=1
MRVKLGAELDLQTATARTTYTQGGVTYTRVEQARTLLRAIDDWTGNGIHSPQPVGPKRTSECFRIIRLEKGRWVRKSPGDYMCDGLTDSGVGG